VLIDVAGWQGRVLATDRAGGFAMVITAAHLSPLLALVFGVLILVFPRLLNYLVASYLILSGLLGLGFHIVR
jgi:hypothetical protein